MFCKKCGFKLKEEDTKCPFCNHEVGKEIVKAKIETVKEQKKVVYQEYQNIFEKADETKCSNIRQSNGYVKLKTSWWHHALIAAGGYLLMNVLYTILSIVVIAFYQASGYDFSCMVEGYDACPTEVAAAYIKASAVSQLISELIIVAVVALIFIKFIKHFFKEFKDKKTWKWFGLSFAMMFGSNYVYSIILTILSAFGINPEVNANQSAVNDIIFGSPLLGFVFVVIAAPLFEEIIFRFGVFRCFVAKDNKKAGIIGLIVTTILFAGVHMVSTFTSAVTAEGINWALIGNDMLSLPTYLIGAFFLTFGYYKSKNFLTPILMHMAWNLISFVAGFIA